MFNWFNDKLEEYHDWTNNVRFIDETHFHLDGYVSSKNCVFGQTKQPQDNLQQHLHSLKVTAWCAINFKTMIGLYWFKNVEGRTITINQKNYCKVVCKLYASVSRRWGIVINQQWYIQDGDPTHTANSTLERKILVIEWFPEKQRIQVSWFCTPHGS